MTSYPKARRFETRDSKTCHFKTRDAKTRS